MSSDDDRDQMPAASRDDDTGWQKYHRRMFDVSQAPNDFIRWKMNSSGVNIARGLMAARNRGGAAWVDEHGPDPTGWPLPHPPAVLWMPSSATAACLRCYWVDDRGIRTPDEAAVLARLHAAEYLPAGSPALRLLAAPLPVWCRDGPNDGPGPTTAG